MGSSSARSKTTQGPSFLRTLICLTVVAAVLVIVHLFNTFEKQQQLLHDGKTTSINHDAELKLLKNQLEQLANDSEKKDGHTKHELELLKAEIQDVNVTTASKLDHHDNAIDDLYSKQQSQQEQQEEEKQKLLAPQKDELDRKDIAPV